MGLIDRRRMKTYEIHSEIRTEQPTAVVAGTKKVAEIGPWLGEAYHSVIETMREQGALPAGPPFARYHQMGGGEFEVEAGFPTSAPITDSGRVKASTLPGGQVARTVHVGPYDGMESTYEAVFSWIAEQGGQPSGDPWEVSLTDPQENPDPSSWRTEIVVPYRS